MKGTDYFGVQEGFFKRWRRRRFERKNPQPFHKGDRVRADVTVYHFVKGRTYTVAACFASGRNNLIWWIYAVEVPVSSYASDFTLVEPSPKSTPNDSPKAGVIP